MGISTDAHCFACGYDTFLMLGAGMENHTTYEAWPVTCKDCLGRFADALAAVQAAGPVATTNVKWQPNG